MPFDGELDPDRIALVAAEVRAVEVVEIRTTTLAAESRTVTPAAENRSVEVPAA